MERELLLLNIMAVFTGVAALALLIMMGFMFGIFRAVRAMQQRSADFMDRFEPLADTSQKTLDQVRQQSTEILKKVDSIADTTHGNLRKLETVLDDVSESTRVQVARIDETVAETLRRVNETVEIVQRTVLIPVRQVRGVAAGLAAAIDSLAGRRPTVDRATLDEEMFI